MTAPREDNATLIIPTDTDPPVDAVRAWLRGALRRLPPPARLHATLVADELVANARRLCSAPYVLRLTVLDRRDTLLVSVDGCGTECESTRPDPALTLVGGLSWRWGVEHRRRARTVWAALVLDTPAIALAAPAQPLPQHRSGGGSR